MYSWKSIMKKTHDHGQPVLEYRLCRRSFLKAGALALGGCIIPRNVLGAAENIFSAERSLSLYNLHTGESLRTVYWFKGGYLAQALTDINRILRDYRTDETVPIDTGLIDLLHTIHCRMGSQEMLHVISGYRSPVTNGHLRGIGRGVAKNSLHMEGKAADIRLPDQSLSALRRAAVELKRGGVGYYPGSDFVHVDVGRVRYW